MASRNCADCLQPLVMGEGEEADTYRTAPGAVPAGKYFCAVSEDAQHHLELCNHSAYPRTDGGCAACEEAMGIVPVAGTSEDVEICGCTNEELEAGLTCGQDNCPNKAAAEAANGPLPVGWHWEPSGVWSGRLDDNRTILWRSDVHEPMDNPPAERPEATVVAWGRDMDVAMNEDRVEFYATRVLAMIHADMDSPHTEGFKDIPRDIGDFGKLHDYRDANMWVIDAMGDLALPGEDDEAGHDLVNNVIERVHQMLVQEAKLLTNKVKVVVSYPDAEAKDASRIHTVRAVREDVEVDLIEDVEALYPVTVSDEMFPRPAAASTAPMTPEQAAAVLLAMQREAGAGGTWGEAKDLTVESLCATNQDALIDDLYEEPGDPHRAEIVALIKVYDTLLGTNRAAEVPAAK